MALIDFGAQVSGKESDRAIRPTHIKLLEIFYDPPELKGYFKKLSNFQIVFRVSGDGDDFGGDGPEFLQMASKGRVVGIDFTIPEMRWKETSDKEFAEYISTGIKDCFKLLRDKAIALNEVVDLEKLDADFESCIQLYTIK